MKRITGVLAVAILAAAVGCNSSSSSSVVAGGLTNGSQNCEFATGDGGYTIYTQIKGITICDEGASFLKAYGGATWSPILYADTVPAVDLHCNLRQETIFVKVYSVPSNTKPLPSTLADRFCLALRNNGWR